jgi:uncharacterized repeat protein (TIGR01451 family)
MVVLLHLAAFGGAPAADASPADQANVAPAATGPSALCGAQVTPVPGTWQAECPMPTPRRLLAAAAEGGKIYTLGGCGSACFEPPLQTSTFEPTRVEVYDPVANSWSARQPMPVILFGAAAVAPGNGMIYTLGGVLSGNVVQQYDPLTDVWSLRQPMPTPRYGLAAVALNQKIYAIGGSGPSNAVEMYDPATDTWTPRAPMPTARVYLAAAAVGGKIYAMGGSPDCCGNSQTAVVEVYDPVADTWAAVAPLPIALQLSAAAGSAGGQVYAFGGFIPGAGAQGPTFAYTPTLNTWTSLAPMPTPRDQAPAALVDTVSTQDPTVYVIGGAIQCHCQALAVNQRYTPAPPQSANLAARIAQASPEASACELVRYSITVTNSGPGPASGAVVTDAFAPSLQDLTWTCTPSQGARCTPASAGVTDHITDQVDLPVGGSITYRVSARLDPAATGVLHDSVSVAPPAGVTDPQLANNQAAADAPIASCAVAVAKTADTAIAQPAGTLGFTIVVTNHALAGVSVKLTDALTAGGLTATAWCRGAGCTALQPAAQIDDVTSVPPGGAATYQVSGTVPCGAQAVSNTACAVGPDGVSRCAGSSVPVAPSCADLETRDLAPAAAAAGTTILYPMRVINHGPCAAANVELSAALPPGLSAVAVPTSCTTTGTTLHCHLGRLAAGASSLVALSAEVPCGFAAGQTASAGSVQSPTCDPVAGNNSSGRSTQIEVQADYRITKTVVVTPAAQHKADPHTLVYTVLATNLGPSCPANVPVSDAFPAGIAWLWCRGAGCTPATTGDLADLVSLAPQTSETYLATATVSAAFTGSVCNTAKVSPPAGVDPDLLNNSATACATFHASFYPEVPALSPAALALLAILLPSLALAWLRRHARHRRR